jgi:phenylpyruvate tautomerase PptA (4-oxalocrotonate tautomerase family)
MAQVKIFGVAEPLRAKRRLISDTIHACIVDVLKLPEDKRAHRFFPLEKEDFFMPADRSSSYTIVELTVMSGRRKETKKALIRSLFDRLEKDVGISPQDLEICIVEAPPENWGFRGFHGDEVKLDYVVEI